MADPVARLIGGTRLATGRYGWVYPSVVSSVDAVSAYQDLDSPETMRDDASEVGRHLPAPHAAPDLIVVKYPRDVPKREIDVTEAAQRVANALELHLD